MHQVNPSLVALAALLSPASAYIRFSCANNLVEQRADPVVNPGQVSPHVHKIAGGAGFGFNMTYEQARNAKCSSCPIKQDLSNYWTPKLYYQAQDGTFTSVPTVGDNAQDLNGGMTVYYQQRGPAAASKTLKAFPPGFRMVAGNPMKRNFTNDFPAQAVNFNCLGANKPETNAMPDYNCPSGLRAQIYFPSCWDGRLDSPDHKSHMSYPASGSHDNGPCPSTHPTQLISLFYEVLYDTNSFKDKWYGSKHPFVFANGDPTGYSFHGDFVNGWDVPTLQKITDTCTDDSKFGTIGKDACPPIDQFTTADMQACRIPSQIDEQVAGTMKALPGCNPVTPGPGPVSPDAKTCNSSNTGTIGQPATYFTDVTKSLGWSYVGCASDSSSTRTLSGKSTVYMSAATANNMTVENCINFCSGFKYAGVEWASQCFCGNDVAADRAPKDGVMGSCNMKCKGDAGEYCGGSLALSLYTKCQANQACTNSKFSAGSNGTAKASP